MQYYVSVFPGLAKVAAEEMHGRLGIRAGNAKRARGAELLPVPKADVSDLINMRICEDVFSAVGSVRLSGDRSDLATISKLALWRGALERALGLYALATQRRVPGRPRFRVVVQADDARWRNYRRIDMQVAAEGALLRTWAGWRLMREEAPLEVWLHQVGRELWVGLRLTGSEHRSRGGREQERAAALRPTIAAAMVWLTSPADEDVFLDPMCGTGTILLERAAFGRYGLLIGGDSDEAAVAAALANFGPRHQPRRIERMDARELPLEDASVDAMASNLPWGRQIGRARDLPDLYAGALSEARRVLRPGARLVLLTSEVDLLKNALRDMTGLKTLRAVGVDVLGRSASIQVLERA